MTKKKFNQSSGQLPVMPSRMPARMTAAKKTKPGAVTATASSPATVAPQIANPVAPPLQAAPVRSSYVDGGWDTRPDIGMITVFRL